MWDKEQAWLDYYHKFSHSYDESNYVSPLQSFAMHASHKIAETAFDKDDYFERVLEIGAGTGEHLRFVQHGFGEYIVTDQNPRAISVAKEKISVFRTEKIGFSVQSGKKLAFPDNSFDRIIAAHVLEHIYYPHIALQEWCRVLRKGGVLTIVLPTDPGIAWRLGRRFGPRKAAIERGVAYDFVMAREHVNSCHNLVAILRHYFPCRRERWWPFPFGSFDLNLFFSCNIEN